jgi:F0F1-type ATP synthase membrane subunit b/b'
MTENDQNQTTATRTDLRQQGQDAVTGAQDTREAVRDAVVRALSRQPLEEGQVRDVVRTVLKGVLDAAPGEGAASAEALKQAAAGIDEALERAAMASKLAIEEARSQAAAFSERDLRRALNDLAAMERWYLETLGAVVKEGTKTSAHILGDLADHLHRTGTRTGDAVRDALADLGRAQPTHVAPRPSDVVRTARVGAATIAAIGSGILAGLADALGTRPGEGRKESPENDAG